MGYSKNKAIAIVCAAAKTYEKELNGRNLLFFYKDKDYNIYSFQTSFKKGNFLHLTGFKTNISPNDFYDQCLDGRLNLDSFEFSEDGTTNLKLDVLPLIICKNLSANMFGQYNASRPYLYTDKIAGGVKGGMGFLNHSNAENYFPNTLLCGDMRQYIKRSYQILLTYRKRHDEPLYVECVYRAKKVDWDKVILPKEFDYLNLPIPNFVNSDQ